LNRHQPEAIVTTTLFLAFLALQALFIWGRMAVFRIEGRTPVGVRVIEVGTVLSIAIGSWLIDKRRAGETAVGAAWADLAALGLVVASASLFIVACRTVRSTPLSAAFCTDTPTHLQMRGPFRWTRNPFYTAYLLGHAVPLAASRSAWALLAPAGMAAVYLCAVRQEERKFLSSPLADAWRAYAARTGRFLPRVHLPINCNATEETK